MLKKNAKDVDLGAVLACVDAKLLVLTEETMPLLSDKIFEGTAKLFSVIDGRLKSLEASSGAPASPLPVARLAERIAGHDCQLLDLVSDLADAQGDILRTASLVEGELTSLVEESLPSLCEKIFERTAKLLVVLDGRVKYWRHPWVPSFPLPLPTCSWVHLRALTSGSVIWRPR
jgi:hypothetical protein